MEIGRGPVTSGFNAVHPVAAVLRAGGAGGYSGDGGGYSWPNVVAPTRAPGASGYPDLVILCIYGAFFANHNGGPGGGVGPYGLGNTGINLADHGLSRSNGRNASVADPTRNIMLLVGRNMEPGSAVMVSITGPRMMQAHLMRGTRWRWRKQVRSRYAEIA